MIKPSAVTVTLRLESAIKDLLQAAADEEHRSMANMVEVLILRHCEANGISVARSRKQQSKKASNR